MYIYIYIGGGVALAEADADNSTNGNASVTSWQGFGGEGGGGSNVETDAELEKNIGDGSYYLPSYFTALVGRGLKGAQCCLLYGYKSANTDTPSVYLLHWYKSTNTDTGAVGESAGVPWGHRQHHSLLFFVPTLLALLAQKYNY